MTSLNEASIIYNLLSAYQRHCVIALSLQVKELQYVFQDVTFLPICRILHRHYFRYGRCHGRSHETINYRNNGVLAAKSSVQKSLGVTQSVLSHWEEHKGDVEPTFVCC